MHNHQRETTKQESLAQRIVHKLPALSNTTPLVRSVDASQKISGI